MEVLQLNDPLEAGLRVAILVEHPPVLDADGLLDPDDLAAGRLSGLGRAGGVGRAGTHSVLEYRQGPLQLPHGLDDGDDFHGAAPFPEGLPEAAMREALSDPSA